MVPVRSAPQARTRGDRAWQAEAEAEGESTSRSSARKRTRSVERNEGRSLRNRMLAQLGIIGGAVVVLAVIVLLTVFGPSWFGSRAAEEARGSVDVPVSDGGSVEQSLAASGDGITVRQVGAPMKIDECFDVSRLTVSRPSLRSAMPPASRWLRSEFGKIDRPVYC